MWTHFKGCLFGCKNLFLGFADELKNAKRLGKFKQYIVGRSSEATFADAFEKQETIMRYLGARDATGEVGFFLTIYVCMLVNVLTLALGFYRCVESASES